VSAPFAIGWTIIPHAKGMPSGRKSLPPHPKARSLQLNRLAKILLSAMACCLMIVVSGCGPAANTTANATPAPGSDSSPQLTISAANLSFGSVALNTATTQSLILTSSGTSPVTVNSATITGAGFSTAQSFPVTLNPSQTLTLQVQFDPATAGALIGQLTITSSSTTGSPSQVALSGTGTAGSGPQATPQLSVSASSLGFGSVSDNTTATQYLTLTSTGTSPVTVNSATIAGTGYSIVQSFPVVLNPSQSLTLQIQFVPTTAGTLTGQLTINSNSTTGSTVQVALSGTGTSTPNPQLTVSAPSLSFGSVTVNTATTQSLTLASTGTSPLTINSVTIIGTGFTIAQTFPVTLNPSQALNLQVQFDPTAAGALNGQLTINSNSTTGATAQVTLSGTGTAVAAHLVDLSWNAPASSPDPVAGYNIYRAAGSGSFVLITSSPDLTVDYVDNSVTSGVTYTYLAKSVDFSGVESTPSNQVTITIP
jgi:hypothetical protein